MVVTGLDKDTIVFVELVTKHYPLIFRKCIVMFLVT